MAKKLAIGILASMAPRVLQETLVHWPVESCSVYIHVDTKFDLANFSFIADHPAVTAITERHSMMWGGFSLADAEISLMKAALSDGFEHFMLISDDTVPILPVGRMIELFQSSSSWYRLAPTTSEEIWGRYRNYYCADMSVSNPLTRTLETLAYKTSDMDHLLDLHVLMKTGKFPLKDLFWSTNWKALPIEDVQYILDDYQDRGTLVSSFRYSLNPDEHYIPTLLGRRPQGFRCIDRFIWADFSRTPSPYILQTRSDADDAVDQGHWFVRKVRDPLLARSLLSAGS